MSDTKPLEFRSSLAELLTGFVNEKRACGYKYVSAIHILRQMDRMWLSSSNLRSELSREWCDRFLRLCPGESPITPIRRTSIWRELARYARRRGVEAYLPGPRAVPIQRSPFVPFIFTRPQLGVLFLAADRIPAHPCSPRRPWIMGLMLRLLYGAGLRLGEALNLKLGDYDPTENVLTIRQGKNQKDRFVPVVPSVGNRLLAYSQQFPSDTHTPIFLSPKHQRPYDPKAIEVTFYELLRMADLPLHVHRTGPRLHDLRHTFAVHRLENWYHAGEDLLAKLPVLSVYMGHSNMRDTYYYLRLTASFFPEVARRLEAYAGNVIPEGGEP